MTRRRHCPICTMPLGSGRRRCPGLCLACSRDLEQLLITGKLAPQLPRGRRVARGLCPIHGAPLAQVGVDQRRGPIVGCTWRDCSFRCLETILPPGAVYQARPKKRVPEQHYEIVAPGDMVIGCCFECGIDDVREEEPDSTFRPVAFTDCACCRGGAQS